MDTFSYSPLPKLTSIRLLKIIKNEEQSPLECELFEIDLDTQDIPHYSALSYCWGDQTDTRDIVCNGKRLTITATLELALRMTQCKNPNEAIWADQVCICQSNMAEKVQQIQVMTIIFQAAWTVIGWLGPEDPTTGLGIQQVETVGKTHGYETHKNEMIASGFSIEAPSSLSTSAQLYNSMEEDSIAWLAFSRFFDRPWFARVWVVQEMLPTLQTQMTRMIDAFLVCGTHVVDWWIVFQAARWAYRVPYPYQRPVHQDMVVDGVKYTNRLEIKAFSRSAYLVSFNPSYSIGRYTFEVLELLRNFRNREATDPKDKVFGLLGLSNFNDSLPSTGLADRSDLVRVAKIPVDYSLSVMETYRAFARAHIENAAKSTDQEFAFRLPLDHPGHGLEILHDTAPRSIEPGWPSWVPDWRSEGHHGHIYFPVTHPSRARSTTVDTVLYTHPDPNCLRVGGLILGRVTWVHEGNHASQVCSTSDPRAVGKFITSQIGPKYKYGSRRRNVNPELYREKSNDQENPENTTDRLGNWDADDWKLALNDAPIKLSKLAGNNENKDGDQATDVAEAADTDIDADNDEPEDTETAFLWTLTLNQLPTVFTQAYFTADEYAETQVLYDSLDIFRSQTQGIPMPDFDQSQFERNARLAAVWEMATSGGHLSHFFASCLCNRRLFFTDSGYLGIAHDDVKVGDDAAILFGMGATCILRPFVMENGEHAHELVGNAWIRGASHGEVIEDMYQKGLIQPGQPVGQPITLR